MVMENEEKKKEFWKKVWNFLKKTWKVVAGILLLVLVPLTRLLAKSRRGSEVPRPTGASSRRHRAELESAKESVGRAENIVESIEDGNAKLAEANADIGDELHSIRELISAERERIENDKI